MKKVLISDRVHKQLIQFFFSKNFQVDYLPDISYKGFKAVLSNYEGVVINSKIKMTTDLLKSTDRLKFIARLGSGLDIIDLKTALSKNIRVVSAPEGNRNAVAEHAMGMLLVLMHNLVIADRELRSKQWLREKNRGVELKGKTVGIIGFGNNGSVFAQKMQGWGVRVLSYDKFKKEGYASDFPWVVEVVLEQLIKESDIISLHVPLTPDTYLMVDTKFLSNCKEGVILINCARGKNVNLRDLLVALKEGKVRGACLDVFENEKPETFTHEEKIIYDELYGRNDVILSPHIAGWTKESFEGIANVLADKLDDYL